MGGDGVEVDQCLTGIHMIEQEHIHRGHSSINIDINVHRNEDIWYIVSHLI